MVTEDDKIVDEAHLKRSDTTNNYLSQYNNPSSAPQGNQEPVLALQNFREKVRGKDNSTKKPKAIAESKISTDR